MRITEEEMEIRRNRMIHAAYRLFNEQGIEGISIDKIARTAGVSSNSIFRYFNNKAQLVEQTQIILWKETIAYMINENLTTRAEAANGLDEIRILLQSFEKLYKNHSDYILFFYNYKSYLIRRRIKLSEEHFEWMFSDIRPLFMHALERGRKDGSISSKLSPDKRFLFIWEIMRCYVEHMVIYSKLYTGENLWETMFPKLMENVLETLEP